MAQKEKPGFLILQEVLNIPFRNIYKLILNLQKEQNGPIA